MDFVADVLASRDAQPYRDLLPTQPLARDVVGERLRRSAGCDDAPIRERLAKLRVVQHGLHCVVQPIDDAPGQPGRTDESPPRIDIEIANPVFGQRGHVRKARQALIPGHGERAQFPARKMWNRSGASTRTRFARIVRGFLHQRRRDDQVGGNAEEQRVSVGRCTSHGCRCYRSGCAGTVFDDDRNVHSLLEQVSDPARNDVRRPPAEKPCRILIGRSGYDWPQAGIATSIAAMANRGAIMASRRRKNATRLLPAALFVQNNEPR